MTGVYDREVDEPTEDEERIMEEERMRESVSFLSGGQPLLVVTKPRRSTDWFGVGFFLLAVWNVAATIALLILLVTR